MFKTWDKQGTGKPAEDVQDFFNKIVDDIVQFLRKRPSTLEAEVESAQLAHVVYDGFATLADKVQAFGAVAGYTKSGEGGMSRMHQFLRDLMSNFENVRAVRDTETPVGLRLFCFALIHFSPILLAPYWNHFCEVRARSPVIARALTHRLRHDARSRPRHSILSFTILSKRPITFMFLPLPAGACC